MRHTDPDAFLAAAAPLLSRNPASQAFLTSICAGWRARPEAYATGAYAATFRDGNDLGLALRRAAGPMIVENSSARAARAFALDVPEALRDVAGVHGEAPACEAFATAWCARFGLAWRLGMRLRHHMLMQMADVPAASGIMRVAATDDLPWLEAMSLAFAAEAGVPDSRETILDGVRQRVPLRRYRIWEDERPVAFAGWSPAEAGARIAPVWTDPNARGRGYGTALTAALSRELLDAGRHPLFLFTDLANPTSNAIYARIGFRPVSDVVRLDFVPRAT